ncbi:hypothetical protein COO60DRAFT_1598846 [Scenedesmus sp. NREL 46B-D3]|nr:hypothetical protein COO60DRAFT_1598846 [Scenedesmus sp. NREL 46B-D3]
MLNHQQPPAFASSSICCRSRLRWSRSCRSWRSTECCCTACNCALSVLNMRCSTNCSTSSGSIHMYINSCIYITVLTLTASCLLLLIMVQQICMPLHLLIASKFMQVLLLLCLETYTMVRLLLQHCICRTCEQHCTECRVCVHLESQL